MCHLHGYVFAASQKPYGDTHEINPGHIVIVHGAAMNLGAEHVTVVKKNHTENAGNIFS
jgi:hypothetical protein